ncbi:MAG: OmpA family protein [Deltaproteobacteria bacterium]|nr:OmpA family protein [Deltaproteobacteria bacterium]
MLRISHLIPALGATLVVAACASSPPSQLVAARDAYAAASHSSASTMAPAELKTAEQALSKAERSFADDGDDVKTIDLAYVAQRRAQIATAIADRRIAEKTKADYQERRASLSDELREETAKELSSAKDELSEKERKVLAERQARVQAEEEAKMSAAEARQAKADKEAAEAKVQEMRDALAKWANLVENERGLVITLSSGVIFKTAKSDVLPAAADRLSQVAALLQVTPDRKVVVEGHTDNAGSDSYNQTLSQERADSVRTFLISHGVDASRVRAIGYGESRPVATNGTVEGRAMNRRVEIVLEPLPVPVPAAKGAQ